MYVQTSEGFCLETFIISEQLIQKFIKIVIVFSNHSWVYEKNCAVL